ncbi:MAG: TetR/AcrR family transcriptional regulator [Hyphomicrobiaceae bacterium]|nr:TetR/AcrR family transcriptional regulator [Hyphomicrobiaceae bacterium]
MNQPSSPRPPGRPRSDATRQAILDASAHLLETESYDRISIERIAAEAKVGKQSIYRWWGGKADVMLAAYTERVIPRLPPREPTGEALADLEDFLKQYFASVRAPLVRRAMQGLLAEAQLDADFRLRFYGVFVASRRTIFRQLLRQGIRDGQLRVDLDVEMVIDLLNGAFWYRLLSGAEDEIDDAFAEGLVRTLSPSLVVARDAALQQG